MSAWSSVVAFSGFHYHGADKAITLTPRIPTSRFASFWSSGAGWGSFSITREKGRSQTELSVTEGTLPLKSILLGQPSGERTSVVLDQKECSHQVKKTEGGTILTLDEAVSVPAGGRLLIRL